MAPIWGRCSTRSSPCIAPGEHYVHRLAGRRGGPGTGKRQAHGTAGPEASRPYLITTGFTGAPVPLTILSGAAVYRKVY